MIASKASRGLALCMVAFSVALVASAAEAGDRNHKDGTVGYVTAESARGETVTAPVRMGPRGYQVLVPKHGWAYCEYKCSYTLRKYYLEFWEYQTDRFIGGGNLVFRRSW
ncbi:MAG: hypothetical protein V3V97_06830 [Hyphomicrobiaceae bacterium]